MAEITTDSECLLTCQIYDSFEDITDLQDEWDEFIIHIKAEIFLTFDWCRIWWKYYGKRRILKIFIFRCDDKIVGLMPIFFETLWLGFFPFRVIKLVSSDFNFAQFTLPVTNDYMMAVMNMFAGMLKEYKWNLFSIGPLSEVSQTKENLLRVCDYLNRNHLKVDLNEAGEHTVFELSNSWDEYLVRLKKKERQLIRSNYKKIFDLNFSLGAETATKFTFNGFFDEFVKSHQAQWRSIGRAGHFGDWPESEFFHREVAHVQLCRDRLRLLKVQVSEDCIAYQYSYRVGERYFEMLMGRSADIGISGVLDIGRLLFSEQMKYAIDQRIKNIDSMRGNYSYKIRLGGTLVPLWRMSIVRPDIFSALSVRVFRGLAKMLDIIYYKLWYCRLGRRFHIATEPLWSLWIRMGGL